MSGSGRKILNFAAIAGVTAGSYASASVLTGIPLFTESALITAGILAASRFAASFLILRDYTLAWSRATANTYLIKTAAFTAAAFFSIPLILLLPGSLISAGFLITETVFFLFGINTAVYLYYFIYNYKRLKKSQTLVIYGAGIAGIMLKDEFRDTDYRILCFIDDKEKLQGRSVDGIPILSREKFLNRPAEHGYRDRPDLLVIAMPSVPMERVKQIFTEMQPYFYETRILPALSELFYTKPFTAQLRAFSLEELLARPPKDLDKNRISAFLIDKKVLVTGAGGSIGSEICRQCIGYGVSELVLLDHSEFALFTISEELRNFRSRADAPMKTGIRPVLASVTNRDYIIKLFNEYQPQIVIHAAAYKHVPLVEMNVQEGLRNNIEGTINTIEAADISGAEKFVLISTDKAVKPSSVMGASKRICELFAQNYESESEMEIVSVRFGNVLGSSGSVVPLFREQIEKGGPVTITHPDITRYFMLIPEACELVLQAAAIAKGGEIFVLDMGEPVKIADLAAKMIELSGKRNIKTEYCGLRPGEKLFEELQIHEEDVRTQYESIWISGKTHYNLNELREGISEILRSELHDEIINKIKKIIPEFQHNTVNEK